MVVRTLRELELGVGVTPLVLARVIVRIPGKFPTIALVWPSIRPVARSGVEELVRTGGVAVGPALTQGRMPWCHAQRRADHKQRKLQCTRHTHLVSEMPKPWLMSGTLRQLVSRISPPNYLKDNVIEQ